MPNIAPTKYECNHCGITQPPWATNETFRRTQYMNLPEKQCLCSCHRQHETIDPVAAYYRGDWGKA